MQAKMLPPDRCLFFHRWRTVHDTGFTVYAECIDCEARKVKQPNSGHQPINTHWLAGLASNEQLRSNAAPPSADKMLDWLERRAQEGNVTMSFEIDGGVHVTLEPMGGEPRAAREVDTVREGIARLMMDEC